MPESPRWQYAKGQQAEAQAGAVKLWGQSGPDQLSEGELCRLCNASCCDRPIRKACAFATHSR